MKKQQVVFIHGGTAFRSREEYLEFLRNIEISLERIISKSWKDKLAEDLGENYQVIKPKMPNALNARYAEWKIYFEKLLALLDKKVVFIGHSMGAVFLAKYFSQNKHNKKIKGIFLVAGPYENEELEFLADFKITDGLNGLKDLEDKVYLYQSEDDPVVPFSDFLNYKKQLPGASVRIYKDREHFNQEDFPEIVEDIKNLK